MLFRSVAMTAEKLLGRHAVKLADMHERGLEFFAKLGPIDVPSGGGLAAGVRRGVRGRAA